MWHSGNNLNNSLHKLLPHPEIPKLQLPNSGQHRNKSPNNLLIYNILIILIIP